MLLDNHTKQSPIIGIAGLGGGINSYIFLSGETGPYIISKSLRFNDNDSAYLTRTPSSASDRQKWTWAAWVKKTSLTTNSTLFSADASSSDFVTIRFESDTIRFDCQGDGQGRVQVTTAALYRDPSAWYHIVIALDTTQSGAADRCKIYINNILQTTSNTITQNKNFAVNSTVNHEIGRRSDGNDHYFDGYLADVHLVDGQQLAPTDFGSTDSDGIWQPKEFSGAHGTNGFHLDFKDNSSNAALGYDAAGSNNFTVNNITAAAPGLATANQGFDVVNYTGNAGTKAVTGLAFQPDLLWLKRRDGASHHYIVDVVRGLGTSERLASDVNDAAGDGTQRVASFNSNGFTVSGNYGYTNISGGNYVAWAWKAGGAASSNTDGSVTSQVSANSTYGFSIVSYVGDGANPPTTLGHGLGKTPKMIFFKNRNDADDWIVYHSGIGATKILELNETAAASTESNPFNNTAPTNSVFTVGGESRNNGPNDNIIAYCWAEVAGFSKFGTFTHTGGGQTLDFGFTPRYWLVKETDGTTPWYIFDAERDNFDDPLYANTNGTEGSGFGFTFSGTTVTWVGGSFASGAYIYAAYASKPDTSVIDSLIDSPSQSVADETDTGLGGQITGNYCTLNPLKKANITTSNGNLDFTHSGSTGNWQVVFSTIGMSSGKYYCEFTCKDTDSVIGLAKDSHTIANDGYVGNDPNGWGYNGQNGNKIHDSSGSSYGNSYTSGDVIGIAFDADGGNLYFYKNGAVQNSGTAAYTGLTDGPYFFVFSLRDTGNTPSVNFGQRAFTHAAPSGYKALTVENLSDPTGPAAEPNKYFDTKLYDGTGSTQALTMANSELSPDFVWIKNRNSTGHNSLFDSVRGATKILYSNLNNAENTIATSLSAFNANGFTVVSDNDVNGSSRTYAAWAWDAGSSTVTNNDGSVTSQVRASAASGFSIVKYTYSSTGTVGHGLNAQPHMIIQRPINSSGDWYVYTKALGFNKAVYLNLNNALGNTSTMNSVDPTSTVFTTNNWNAGDNLAYCFAPVENYSAINIYTGNGSSDGIFVHTGFKPAFLLTKRTNASENWEIRDNRRNPSNRVNRTLFPHTSGAEDNGSVDVDFLSNGFKIRTANGSINANGGIYLYYAVAEEPFKSARAR